jgi:hypothetical protein
MATLCLLLLRYLERQQTTFATGKLLTSFELLRTQGRRRSLKAQGVLGPPAAISCDPALVCVTQASRAPRNATIQRISSKDCDVPGGKLGNISTCCETRPRRDGLFRRFNESPPKIATFQGENSGTFQHVVRHDREGMAYSSCQNGIFRFVLNFTTLVRGHLPLAFLVSVRAP